MPAAEALETFTHLVRFEEEAESLSDELGPDASARDGAELYLSRQGLSGDALRRARFLLRLILQQTDAIDWRKLNFDYTAHYDPVYTGVGQGNFPEGGYIGLITRDGRRHRRPPRPAGEADRAPTATGSR